MAKVKKLSVATIEHDGISGKHKMEIDVVLKFKKEDIETICNAIHMDDEKLGKALFKQLKNDEKLFALFSNAVQTTSFIDEILDGLDAACANDWLAAFNVDDSD